MPEGRYLGTDSRGPELRISLFLDPDEARLPLRVPAPAVGVEELAQGMGAKVQAKDMFFRDSGSGKLVPGQTPQVNGPFSGMEIAPELLSPFPLEIYEFALLRA
jgi:hypothetical protein